MKQLLFLGSLISSLLLNAQSFEKEWVEFSKVMESGETINPQKYQVFETKHEKSFEKFPDYGCKFYSYFAYALLAVNDTINALEGFKYSYHYAKKSRDTTLKHIVTYRFGDYYQRIGNNIEAEKYYYASMYPLSVILGPSSREYSIIYFEYTQLLLKLQKYTEAKPAVDGLLYYFKTLDGENSEYYIMLLNYKAAIHHQFGEYKACIDVYNQLISSNAHLNFKDTSGHVEKYSALGDVYREMGDYNNALVYLKKCKAEYHRLKFNEQLILAGVDNNLGLCYKMLGLNNEAELAFKSSLSIYEQLKETKTDAYCITLNNMGDFYRELGRKGVASEILLKALAIRKNYLNTNTRSYANLLNNLGLVYIDAEFYDEALIRLEEAKEVYQSTVGKQHQYYGNCLNNLASCYFYLKNYKKAEEFKLQALKVVELSVGKDHFRYPTFLIALASIYFKTGYFQKAEANLKEALSLIEKNFGKAHDLYANAQLSLAEVYSATMRMEEAGPLYLQSLQHYTNQLNTYFDAMSEGHQGEFLAMINPLFESYEVYLLNYIAQEPKKNLNQYILKGLENQLLLKSLIGRGSAKLQQTVLNSKNEEVIKLYQDWVTLKNNLLSRSKSFDRVESDNDLLLKINDIETKLKLKVNGITKNETITVSKLKSALKPKEALLEFFSVHEWINDSTSHKIYGAFVVKNNSATPELVVYKNGDKLEDSSFNIYSKSIDELLIDTLSYVSYFGPLQKSLKEVERLYVSSDGVFQKINLSSLYNPRTNKYLGESIEITNLINASSLLENASKTKTNEISSAMLFGNPDFDYDLKKQIKGNEYKPTDLIASRYGLVNLSKLPGTKKEVETIEAELNAAGWNVKAFLEEKASESNIRSVNSPAVLHIATHGYYLKDVETEDKMFLGFERQSLKENSFLRSGLILAGVGPSTSDSLNLDSQNDGVLTAYEAGFLNLAATDLVVLSACQTGLGDNMGSEGVAGLQRSLAIAGAKHLIMSLWPVDDLSTNYFMTMFYKTYAKTKNVSLAYKNAQVETRLKYPHPNHWAAFILIKTFN
jgi:CHAT domain-containing protein